MKSDYFDNITSNLSTFYHLEPIGIGTPLCESLSSYIIRLSHAHCVSVYSIFKFSLRYPNKLQIKDGRIRLSIFRNIISINGTGLYASEFSRIFSSLTMYKGLDNLTMLPLQGLLGIGGRGLFRPTKAWCPLCYKEQGVKYDPLIWALCSVEICTIHQTKLINKCPTCGALQPTLNTYVKIGSCFQCGMDLSICETGTIKQNDVTEKQKWMAQKIETLVSNLHLLKGNVSQQSFQQVLTRAIEKLTDGNASQLEREIGFGMNTIHQWRRGRCFPNFSLLLEFLYSINADPLDFLCGKETNIHLDVENQNKTTKKTSNRKKNHDHKAIEQKLDQIIQNSKSGYSIYKLCELLSVSKGYLQYRFPQKTKIISERYALYNRVSIEKRKLKEIKLIQFAVNNLISSNKYPTKSGVFSQKYGFKATDAMSRYLADAWKNELIKNEHRLPKN